MNSLEFFRPSEPGAYNPKDWGSGRPPKEKINLSLPRNATWRYTGKPVAQYYGLTKLKQSNVRTNDELVPKPQAVDVGKEAIDLPFPAEHPYTSHITKFALFPKFESSEDEKRGVAARKEQPISSETPANAADVIIRHKIKGAPYRHEFQDMPAEGQSTGLHWPGEDFFDQPAKIHGHRQQYYPTPTKTMCPNPQDRQGDMKLSPRTANALRNVEREQWMTCYQQQFTGLGPANPMKLDNLQDKRHKFLITGLQDDKLYPCTQNTLDPPRPLEGRLPAKSHPVPIHGKALGNETQYDDNYNRKMTLTEKEEHRLLYGADYINLPDTTGDPHRDLGWQELDSVSRAGPCLEQVERAKAQMEEAQHGGPPAVPAPEEPCCKEAMKTVWDHRVQEMEAQNRWKVLDAQSPRQERTALNVKMAKVVSADKPTLFYNHHGRYNEERAGLYKTSYDPHTLTHSMTGQCRTPSEVTNNLHSNAQSQLTLSLPAARLNEDVNAALKWSRTFNLSKPELSGDRRQGTEVIQTYTGVKNRQQKSLLPPNPQGACPRLQERELLQQDATSTGQAYNTTKFLQDHNISRHARNEPYLLMSTQNQSLDRVRNQAVPRPSKNVQFSQSVTVATVPPSSTSPTPSGLVEVQPVNMDQLPDHAPSLHNETPSRPPSARYIIDQDSDLHGAIDQDPVLHREPTAQELRHSAPPKLSQAVMSTPTNQTAVPSNDTFTTNTTTTTTTTFAGTTSDTRHVHFSDENCDSNTNSNSNAGGGGEEGGENYRSFPLRAGASHGHGTRDSEYTDRYRCYRPVPMGTRQHPAPVSTSCPAQVLDMSYKKDACFDWNPGCGVPRKQTSLLKMQDAFVKTEVRRKFHASFPENGPDLRRNVSKGRRNNFWGYHSSVLHG